MRAFPHAPPQAPGDPTLWAFCRTAERASAHSKHWERPSRVPNALCSRALWPQSDLPPVVESSLAPCGLFARDHWGSPGPLFSPYFSPEDQYSFPLLDTERTREANDGWAGNFSYVGGHPPVPPQHVSLSPLNILP